jgi:hypothetical protein
MGLSGRILIAVFSVLGVYHVVVVIQAIVGGHAPRETHLLGLIVSIGGILVQLWIWIGNKRR